MLSPRDEICRKIQANPDLVVESPAQQQQIHLRSLVLQREGSSTQRFAGNREQLLSVELVQSRLLRQQQLQRKYGVTALHP